MATIYDGEMGAVAGAAPKPDAFETTLKGKADGYYAGWQLQFLTGGLARFSARIADYRGQGGLVMIDGSFPTAPQPGDDFVVQRPGADDRPA